MAQIGGRDAGALRSASCVASSSQAITSAPPAISALHARQPEPPRPNTATVLPAKVVTGIIARACRRQEAASMRVPSPLAGEG